MKVAFTTLGCKLNQAEVERWQHDFRAAGHEVTNDLNQADLHVVNSCAVTAAASRDSRKAAGRGARAAHPIRTVLAGCYTSSEPEQAARLAGVDLAIPNGSKERLVALVAEHFPELWASTPQRENDAVEARTKQPWVRGGSTTRAFLKIEDGCNLHCAFCIIPSLRGEQRSRGFDEIVAEVDRLARSGVNEIVVTGVQISAYRDSGARLPDLTAAILRTLRAASPTTRLRLTSIAPWEFDPRLFPLWQDERLCRHVHLSLQSGSAATLARMTRPSTPERYARLLERLRREVPEVAVTTDVIVGFPGETDAEFEESLAFVRAARFAKIHAFPFSPRPQTAAAQMPNPVPSTLVNERMQRLLEVARTAEREHGATRIGQAVNVLWERPRQGSGVGWTDDYVRVFCPEARDLAGRFAVARVLGLAGLAGDGAVLARLVGLDGDG